MQRDRCGTCAALGVLVGVVLAGCSQEAYRPEEVGTEQEPLWLYDAPNFTANNWNVPVCFRTAGFNTEKGMVQDAILNTWFEETKLSFTGWGTCPDPIPASTVSIEMILDPLATSASGLAAPGVGGRITGSNTQMRVTFNASLNSLKNVAVHEMGHVIGMVHEHQRPDRDAFTDSCTLELQRRYPQLASHLIILTNGYNVSSDFDRNSIMSYCRDGDANGTADLLEQKSSWGLSFGDRAAVKLLYGTWNDDFIKESGYAQVQSPGGTSTVDVPEPTSWNSYGRVINRVTRIGTGKYQVDIPRLAYVGGANYQVTTHGTNNRCKVESFTTSGTTHRAVVRCRTPSGADANADFFLSFVNRNDISSLDGGYTYADQPTVSSYTPNSAFTWNGDGWPTTITRFATGQYRVVMTGQASEAPGDVGNVEVTAVGTGNQFCKPIQLSEDDDFNRRVGVECYNAGGARADSAFFVNYGRRALTLTPSYSYALATQPTTPSYTPPANFQKTYLANNCGNPIRNNAITVQRTATGRYTLTSAGFPSVGTLSGINHKPHIQVNAWGNNSNHCTVTNWIASSTNIVVNVDCYSGTTRADSMFTINMASMYTDICSP